MKTRLGDVVVACLSAVLIVAAILAYVWEGGAVERRQARALEQFGLPSIIRPDTVPRIDLDSAFAGEAIPVVAEQAN